MQAVLLSDLLLALVLSLYLSLHVQNSIFCQGVTGGSQERRRAKDKYPLLL